MRLFRRSLVAAVSLSPAPLFAQELPVRFDGVAPPGVAARVRAELDALGHGSADTSTTHAIVVSFDASRERALVAWVTAPSRAPLRVEVALTEPDAAAVFALRVAEAVRASVLRPPERSAAPPAPAPTVVVRTAAPEASRRLFSFGLGARGLVSPGGVGPMLLPAARATLGFGGESLSGLVEMCFAGPSLFGETSASVRLSAIEVSVGAAAVFKVSSALRIEGGARASFLALRVDGGGGVQTSARDGQWSASAVAALRWGVNARVSLRVGGSIGATLGAVDLGIGARTVAEWGRPVAGLELGVEAHF